MSHRPLITSRHNPLVKRVARARRTGSAVIVEGVRPVWAAFEAGACVEALMVAPERLRSGGGWDLVELASHRGIRVAHLADAVFCAVAARDNPSGLLALAHAAAAPLDHLAPCPSGLYVACHQLRSPGNLGTVIRTADATGATAVICSGDGVKPFHPKAVSASLGTVFSMPLYETPTARALLDWSRAGGVTVIATSARATRNLWSAPIPRPAVIVFGNEGTGLPDELVGWADAVVGLPVVGHATSINVAAAAAVFLYEEMRRSRVSE